MARVPIAVLLIEGEAPTRLILRSALARQEFSLVETETKREGLRLARSHNPDLVLLDVALPDGSGVDVASELRTWTDVPIIVLSARSGEADKIAALDAGADDYLTKPFGVPELLARIRSVTRHAAQRRHAASSPVIEVGDLRIELDRRQVFLRGSALPMTPTQYRLLVALARGMGKIKGHNELLRDVWGPDRRGAQRLRAYVAQLRRLLEDDPARPRYIVTEAGIGYRFHPRDQLPNR